MKIIFASLRIMQKVLQLDNEHATIPETWYRQDRCHHSMLEANMFIKSYRTTFVNVGISWCCKGNVFQKITHDLITIGC